MDSFNTGQKLNRSNLYGMPKNTFMHSILNDFFYLLSYLLSCGKAIKGPQNDEILEGLTVLLGDML